MSKHRRIRILLVCIALILLAAYLGSLQPGATPKVNSSVSPAPGYYRIAHFVDGDTIDVYMNNTIQTIRFIGMDTPETKKPDTPVQCYGPEASNYTKQAIGSQPVRLVADPVGDNRDKYNRLLRYVYLPDSTLLNEQLILKGYAFAYVSFPFSKKAQFAEDQIEAQQDDVGLWAACQPTHSRGGRWQSNSL